MVTIGLAIVGFVLWNREFVGRRQIELAEEILRLFHLARDIIQGARAPIIFGGEGTSRKPEPGETPELKEIRDWEYVVIERLGRYKETFARMASIRYECIARFGEDFRKPFDEFLHVISELNATSRVLAIRLEQIAAHPDPEKEKRRCHEELMKLRRIVTATAPEGDDTIKQKVDKLVTEIEMRCRPIIAVKPFPGKGTLDWLSAKWSAVAKWVKQDGMRR